MMIKLVRNRESAHGIQEDLDVLPGGAADLGGACKSAGNRRWGKGDLLRHCAQGGARPFFRVAAASRVNGFSRHARSLEPMRSGVKSQSRPSGGFQKLQRKNTLPYGTETRASMVWRTNETCRFSSAMKIAECAPVCNVASNVA
jgi:hypothetical protein